VTPPSANDADAGEAEGVSPDRMVVAARGPAAIAVAGVMVVEDRRVARGEVVKHLGLFFVR
jgi:hypothetical protein